MIVLGVLLIAVVSGVEGRGITMNYGDEVVQLAEGSERN